MRKPIKVCEILDITGRSWKYTDHELHGLACQMYEDGIDYLRWFPLPVWGLEWKGFMPWERDNEGVFNMEIWNEDYWNEVARLEYIFSEWKIAFWTSLNDHCGTRKKLQKNNPWYNNCNGISGLYDTRTPAMVMRERFTRKMFETVGLKAQRSGALGKTIGTIKHLYGLGNELYCRGNHSSVHAFGREFALPQAEMILANGYKPQKWGKVKIMYSAHDAAAHAIEAYVSPEGEPWGSTVKYGHLVRSYHGWAYPIDATPVLFRTRHRGMGYSDDGTNVHNPADKGICINVDRYCSANIELVEKLCSAIVENVKERNKRRRNTYFHHFSQLPRSISETYHSLLTWKERDREVYDQVWQSLYGKSCKRTAPKWRKRKHGLLP